MHQKILKKNSIHVIYIIYINFLYIILILLNNAQHPDNFPHEFRYKKIVAYLQAALVI